MITSLARAKEISSRLKKSGKKIGLCHGCFDVFHFGHVNYLQKAKNLCDILFVSVSPDRFVKKGKSRPIFSCRKRMSVLSSIKYIDYVFSNTERTAVDSIRKIKPYAYFKGNDYKRQTSKNYGLFLKEKRLVCRFNGKTILLNEPSSSSTMILNKIISKQ